MTKLHQRERGEQAGIVKLLRSLGAKVYTLGTTRRTGDYQGTMQSPGLPDVLAFLETTRVHGSTRGDVTVCLQAKQLLAVEVKAAGGRLRPEQAEFRELAIAAHVAHVVGGLDDVVAWLIAHGYLRDSHVPHYRVMPDTGERL